MRRLGPCLCSCLLVLYVLCGQVSLSSHVLRSTRGLITLPPLFIWREEERRRGKMKERSAINGFPSLNLSQGQVCSWGPNSKTHRKSVCMCVRQLLQTFDGIHLISARLLAWCHLILSEDYCLAILGRTSSPRLWSPREHTLKKDDVMARTRTLINCN